MAAVSDIEHDHTDGLYGPPMTDPRGQPIDQHLILAFMGASIDGCETCTARLLPAFATEATAVARVVELACIATQHVFDGLPVTMADPDDENTAIPAPFRRLCAAGLEGNNIRMYQTAEAMTAADRCTAVDAAARILMMIEV